MKKILFMLLLCTPLLYMGCKAEPEWVNLIAQQEQEKAKKQAASTDTQWQNHDSVWESLNKKYGV